jgi:hypothetical protein
MRIDVNRRETIRLDSARLRSIVVVCCWLRSIDSTHWSDVLHCQSSSQTTPFRLLGLFADSILTVPTWRALNTLGMVLFDSRSYSCFALLCWLRSSALTTLFRWHRSVGNDVFVVGFRCCCCCCCFTARNTCKKCNERVICTTLT